jgi:hypothetical protein
MSKPTYTASQEEMVEQRRRLSKTMKQLRKAQSESEERVMSNSDLIEEARAFVKADLRTSRTGSGGIMSNRASIVERLANEVKQLQALVRGTRLIATAPSLQMENDRLRRDLNEAWSLLDGDSTLSRRAHRAKVVLSDCIANPIAFDAH